jgi:hypothetical protein
MTLRRIPLSAGEILALVVLTAVGLLVHGWIAAVDMGIIGFSDTVDYLYLTDFYRGQFAGQVDAHAAEYYRITRLPPLYPLMLAALGAGTHDLHWTQVVASALTLAMFAPMWWWLRLETGSRSIAATTTALVLISPGLFLLSLKPASEPLAMAMTWVAFMLAANPRKGSDGHLLLALVIGLSALVRSANIALVAALPVWLYLQRSDRTSWIKPSLVAIVPVAAWMVYRRSFAEAESYLAAMSVQNVVAQLGGWPDLLYLHPWTLFLGLVKNFDPTPGTLSIVTVAILSALAALGGWSRLRSGRLDAIFVVFYLGLVLVWPYPAEAARFMTFVLPIFLLHAALGLRQLLERTRGTGGSGAPASIAISSLALVASIATLQHFAGLAMVGVDPELRPEQREQLYFLAPDRATAVATADASARVRLAAAEAARSLPPGACVYSTLPHLFVLRAPVRTVRYPRSLAANVAPQEQLSDCDYFFVAAFSGNVPGESAFHLADALVGWTEPVLVAQVELDGKPFTLAALMARIAPEATHEPATER